MLRIGLAYIVVALFGLWMSKVSHFRAETLLIVVVSSSVTGTRHIWGMSALSIKWALAGGLTLLVAALEFALIPAGLRVDLFLQVMLLSLATFMVFIWRKVRVKDIKR